ncbi:MAG: thrombospondin type 3 repeat-containing protein [Polyangiaceae bacterium]|nr:thrombospondin type 3 repeat-containing protein [Polyangiaceae bacterium]
MSIALFVADVARAEAPSVNTRTWRPSTDPSASMIVEPAMTPGPGVYSFGGYASYAYRPLILHANDTTYRIVKHATGFDAVANLGIGKRFAVGADVPLILYQTGGLPPAVSDKVPATAMGDIGLTMKGTFVPNESGGFGLAGIGLVTLPTGGRSSFASDGSVTVGARIIAEYTLLIAAVQASLGYTLRTDHRTWPGSDIGGYRFGDEIPWSIGFMFRPGILGVDPGNRQRWEIAAHGSVPAGPVGPFGAGDPGSAALSPALLGVSDRVELGHYRDAFVLVGAEVGLNQAIGVPVFRGIVSVGWAPRDHDMDHDGIPDDVDGCPEIPEDKDGFEDSDGCPDIDNDEDGILDKDDACPNVPGEPSSDPARNGCPP